LQLKAQELQAKTALEAAKAENSKELTQAKTRLDGVKAAGAMYAQQQQAAKPKEKPTK
jgi:hypothetical protein